MNDIAQPVQDVEPQTSIPSRNDQTRILLNKTLMFLRRKWNFYAYHLLIIPLSFFWIAYVNYLIATKSVLQEEIAFQPQKLNTFDRCSLKDCLPLGIVLYSKNQDAPVKQWINDALAHVKQKLDLKGPDDVKVLYNGSDTDDIERAMNKYSEVSNVLYFCNEYPMFDNDLLTLDCERFKSPSIGSFDVTMYGVAYNQTKISPNFLKNYNIPMNIDKNSVLLKKVMDEFIINYYRKDSSYFIPDEGVSSFNSTNLPSQIPLYFFRV